MGTSVAEHTVRGTAQRRLTAGASAQTTTRAWARATARWVSTFRWRRGCLRQNRSAVRQIRLWTCRTVNHKGCAGGVEWPRLVPFERTWVCFAEGCLRVVCGCGGACMWGGRGLTSVHEHLHQHFGLPEGGGGAGGAEGGGVLEAPMTFRPF